MVCAESRRRHARVTLTAVAEARARTGEAIPFGGIGAGVTVRFAARGVAGVTVITIGGGCAPHTRTSPVADWCIRGGDAGRGASGEWRVVACSILAGVASTGVAIVAGLVTVALHAVTIRIADAGTAARRALRERDVLAGARVTTVRCTGVTVAAIGQRIATPRELA